MGTYKKSWHASIDSKEQIESCLVCVRTECVDCIGRRLEGAVGIRKRKKRKSVRKED